MKRKLSILSAILAATLAIPAAALGNPPNGYSAHIGTSGWTVTAVDNPSPSGYFGHSVVQGPYATWNESESCVQQLVHGVWRTLSYTVYIDPGPGKALWNNRTDTRTPNAMSVAAGDTFRTWAWAYVMTPSHHWQAAAVVSPTYTIP